MNKSSASAKLLIDECSFQIVNRRSMSKSFFGATKRLFGSGKSIGSVV
jgi:hypothetical protein